MDRVFRRLVRFGFCGPAGALWNHARLIPLKKQDGVGVRPIAVGEIMRRIAGKLALRSLGDAATASLLPHQYGVGRRAGADAVLLGAQLALFDGAGTTAALKIDLHNPLTRYPGYGSGTWCSPASRSSGHWSGPHVQHFWYLDDGLVVGTPAQLAGFLAAFEMCGSAKGLHINRAKTQLVLPAGVAASEAGPFPGLTDLPVVEWSSAQLLGAPLDASGTSESLVPLHALAAHVVALAERVARLPNPELAFHLLRGSVGPRRLAYLARVMPPGVMDALFRTFDHQWRVGWTRAATTFDRTPEGVVAPSYARWEALHCADALALSAAGALQDDDEPEALLTSQARGTNRFYHNLQRDWLSTSASEWEFQRRHSLASPYALAWLSMPSTVRTGAVMSGRALEPDVWLAAVRHLLGLPVRGHTSGAERCPLSLAPPRCVRPHWTRTATMRSHALSDRRASGGMSSSQTWCTTLRWTPTCGPLASSGTTGPLRCTGPMMCAAEHGALISPWLCLRTGAGLGCSAIAREVRVKLSEYAAHTPDPPAAGTGVTFVPLVFDVYGRVHAGTGPFFKDLAAAYQRTHEVGHRLASAALRRALSLGIYRAAGSAIVLRHTRHRPSVAARQWLSAGALTLATSSVHTESDD
ncbi:hypothetical protein FVE85_9590 [Porphyridium purpureum]|uniref:Reverse transcriptase domain-containing protein n=1 Tax=Porphyridium purpureum TaxID=35688 RepID=A0A5J4YG43_PORPP|nr:hypothetical protein FVE85_9590 [Porphyridium purpureum]|eukprot:POR1271..scf219_40